MDAAVDVLDCGVLMRLTGGTTGQLIGTRFLGSEGGGVQRHLGTTIALFLGLYCFGFFPLLTIVGLGCLLMLIV